MSIAAPTGFKRQVLVRIGPDEHELLEAAVREHGSQQAALVAGLRALDERRQGDAGRRGGDPSDLPPGATATTPGTAGTGAGESAPGGAAVSPEPAGSDEDWWIPAEAAQDIFGLSDAQLRRRARQSGAPMRTRQGRREVNLTRLQVDTAYVASAAGVSVDTARSWGKAGRMGAVSRGGQYWFPLGAIEIPIASAASMVGERPIDTERRFARGALRASKDDRGRRVVRLLDVIDELGQG